MASSAHAIVWGGNGALGQEMVTLLKSNHFTVTSVDFIENKNAHQNVILKGKSLEEDVHTVLSSVSGFDVVISAAGGWSGGGIASKEIFSSSEKMWKFNVESSLAASHVAAKHLKENGLLVLTGASAATGPTPGMIGYGIAKAAVHQLVSSLAAKDSGLPKGSAVAAVLPITLDSPANRKGMPGADFGSWTPCSELASHVVNWAIGKDRPASGSLIEVRTASGATTYHNVTISVSKS